MGRQSPRTLAVRNSALADREAVLSKMNPALRSVFSDLQTQMVDRIEDNIRFYHQIGVRCKAIKADPNKYLTDEQKLAGINPLDLLGAAASTSKGTFQKCTVFAETYDKEDLQRIFKYRNEEDKKWRLHWGHICVLLSVSDGRQRIRFEEESAKHMWEPTDLAKAVQEFFGGKRSKGQRPFAIPKTVPSQISQIRNLSSTWVKKNSQIWNGEKNNVFNNILQLEPEKYTPALLKDLRGMDHEFDDMQRHLEADRNVLKGVIERVESAVAATSDTPAAEKPTPAPKAEKPAEKAKSTKPPAAVAAKPAAAKQAVVAAVGSGLKGTVSPDARARAAADRSRPRPR